MLNLKKLLKSKTFFIPALSYIGIVVLFFIGACLESIKIFPTGDMGGLFSWALIFASLPIVWLQRPLMIVFTFIHFKSISGALVIASLVLYHLLIGFIVGFLINFSRLKSRKTVDIDKTSESTELESSKQEISRRKSSTQKIVLIILGAIAVLGLVMLAWTLLDKSSPISQAVCQQKVKQTAEVIKKANYCVEDNDCIAVKSWFCGNNLVNQERRNEVKQKIKLLNKWCVPPLVICPEPPVSFKCLNGKCEFVEEKTKEVVIQTDKTEYQKREMIEFTVVNNLNEPIQILPRFAITYRNGQIPVRVAFLTYQEDKILFPIAEDPNYPYFCSESCGTKCIQLEPMIVLAHSEDKIKWNQEIHYCKDSITSSMNINDYLNNIWNSNIKEARFSLDTEYWFLDDENNHQFIVSQIFKIFEKNQISQPENYCEKDEDCVLTTIYDGCCWTCGEKAVNKVIAAKEEQNRKKVCDIKDSKTCLKRRCKTSLPAKPVCENNLCKKMYYERE